MVYESRKNVEDVIKQDFDSEERIKKNITYGIIGAVVLGVGLGVAIPIYQNYSHKKRVAEIYFKIEKNIPIQIKYDFQNTPRMKLRILVSDKIGHGILRNNGDSLSIEYDRAERKRDELYQAGIKGAVTVTSDVVRYAAGLDSKKDAGSGAKLRFEGISYAYELIDDGADGTVDRVIEWKYEIAEQPKELGKVKTGLSNVGKLAENLLGDGDSKKKEGSRANLETEIRTKTGEWNLSNGGGSKEKKAYWSLIEQIHDQYIVNK